MKNEIILVINAGSSSIKFSLFTFDKLTLIYHGEIQKVFSAPTLSIYDKDNIIVKNKNIPIGYESAMQTFFNWLDGLSSNYIIKAVGHRVVHGGKDYINPIKITNGVVINLTKLIPLAPLHQWHNINAINIISKLYPKLAQVACFDTAFHSTQPKLARLFALPRRLTAEGIIRYGFHGLSYEYIASVLSDYLGKTASGKIIVAHLGNGASMCAIHQKKSIATSMGFTALDGLMMGTRCGNIDPGVILYLLHEKKYNAEEVTHLLYEQSGLLGFSEISGDMQQLELSRSPKAIEAIQLFCYRAAIELGALVIALKGCDAIVFTAGIGENSAQVRKGICEWLDCLDLQISDEANENNFSIISHENSKVLVAVIPTNEEYMIAKHTLSLI